MLFISLQIFISLGILAESRCLVRAPVLATSINTKRNNTLRANWISWHNMNHARYLSLLTVSSIGNILSASLVVSHPFHVIALRQQAGVTIPNANMGNVFKATNDVFQLIGWKGFLNGVIPVLFETPSYAIYYAMIEFTRDLVINGLFRKGSRFHPYIRETIQSFICGIAANSISLLPWIPCEIIKSKLAMLNTNDMNSITMIRSIYQNEGLQGFFKGYSSTLVTQILYSFGWWASYSIFRIEITKYSFITSIPLLNDFIPGLIAGGVACICSHPFDTLRARIMTGVIKQENIFLQTMRVIKQEGFLSLYDGLFSSLCATAVSSAVFSVVYEYIKRLSSIESPSPQLLEIQD